MSTRASVTVTAKPLWRIRLGRSWTRYAMYALAVWGLAASARFAIAPPKTPAPKIPHIEVPERSAEGFAALFARRYLTWNASAPETYRKELEPFLGEGALAQGATQLPAKGEQQVQWTEIVQSREVKAGEHIYTIAAQTDTAGLLYLTVDVLRQSSGSLSLGAYPAFVGAPNSTTLDSVTETLKNVEDASLSTVIDRALSNYLSGSASELAADLSSEAQVSLPGMPLTLQSVSQLKWLPGHESVIAVANAKDQRGAQYTLTYELDVSYQQGRWEISAIQMNPDT
jgi:hypothetical protein